MALFQENLADCNWHVPTVSFAAPLFDNQNFSGTAFLQLQGWACRFANHEADNNTTPADGFFYTYTTFNTGCMVSFFSFEVIHTIVRYFEIYPNNLKATTQYFSDYSEWTTFLRQEAVRCATSL
jgi:hypothetical protein